jgi:hypothetical protein
MATDVYHPRLARHDLFQCFKISDLFLYGELSLGLSQDFYDLIELLIRVKGLIEGDDTRCGLVGPRVLVGHFVQQGV